MSNSAILKVKVVPGASRDRVVRFLGDALKIQVSAPPERGKANGAVIEILAETLGIPSAQIVLMAGAGNPRKQFRIDGLSADQLLEKLKKFRS
jgi:uncharacterized protein (TIGR00251 family)